MIKNLSIKTQLTILYALSMLIVALVLFASFFYITQNALISETDASLEAHAAQIAENIGLNTNNVFDSQTKEIVEVSGAQLPGIFLTITDLNGHDVRSGSEESTYQFLALDSIKEAAAKYSYQKIAGTKLRFISIPIKNDKNIIGAVIMGHPIDNYENALLQLKNIAFLTAVFLVIPSIMLGYLLSTNATAPIVDLARRIEKISTENLTNRITVPSKSLETYTLVNNFNSLMDRLNEAFKRERQFIGDAAHEIKTPLAVIKTNAEVTLLKDREAQEYKNSLAQVLTHTDKLAKRLSGLIDFAWTQTVDVYKQFSRVNLSHVLQEVCENSKQMAKAKNIKIKCVIQKDVFVLGKEEKLAQVFYNLMDNAVKYTPDSRNITVNLTCNERTVLVKVADTGIGIEKSNLENIFDRFYRTKESRGTPGHGLGLAIAYSIVTAHKGVIEVVSTVGQGTTFAVTLPRF